MCPERPDDFFMGNGGLLTFKLTVKQKQTSGGCSVKTAICTAEQ
jgi:hypothetical protein